MRVAVIGASPKPERYSYQAIRLLIERGHTPYPVHPSLGKLDDLPVYKSLRDIHETPHTVTIYLAARNQSGLQEDLLACRPVRVIFNPGAENRQLTIDLQKAGIECVEACTLVMLRTGQF